MAGLLEVVNRLGRKRSGGEARKVVSNRSVDGQTDVRGQQFGMARHSSPTRLTDQQERATSFSNLAAQVIAAIRDDLEDRDPDSWHWLQDLYVDSASTSSANGLSTEELFAVTVSGGRLYRWPIAIDGATVTIGEPTIVEVEFTAAPDASTEVETTEARSQKPERRNMIRQAPDGSWFGVSVMCTATVNKMGILDSRKLFDSFIERFKGPQGAPRKEYINILHLGGAASRIGDVRHIFRDDKLLVGFYTFTKDDPIAAAAAQTLANDEAGEWGGSIEFNHFGPMERVTVAEGIELPMTTDGEFLGYSFARSADCAAWNTCNLVLERMAMTDKDKKIARELLGSDELVELLAKRLGETNRTMEGAITYTVKMQRTGAGSETVVSNQSGDDAAPADEQGEPITYELDEEAVGLLSQQVIERANLSVYEQHWAEVTRQMEELGQKLETLSGLMQGQAEAFELRQAHLTERMVVLEQDEEQRYQEYDALKPKQPAIKIGVRPRDGSTSSTTVLRPAVDVRVESGFVTKLRERRSGK